jgi:hypothetical protein
MSFTPSTTSPQGVAPDSTFAAQTNDPIVLLFNALHSLLKIFNLDSLIPFPGQSNPGANAAPTLSLLKILVIGLVAEFARRYAQDVLSYLSERFYITVSLTEHDPCYGMSTPSPSPPFFSFLISIIRVGPRLAI